LTFDYLEQQAINYQEPARNLINAAWNGKIHRHASERGAVVLLNGQLGNLTLNFGGIEALPYWLDQGRIGDWWRQAKAAVDRGDVRWRGALFNSFQSWLPAPVWRQLRRAGMKANRDTGFFLHPDLREAVRSAQATPPPHNPSSDRMTMIGKLDHGMYTKGMIAEVGMEDIDPLADRRLMEFSLRLPPEQMLDRGLDRPLARRALASWLPASFFDSKPRGIQAADWPIRFPRSHAEEAYEAIESNAGVATILDLKRIREAIRRWPRDDTEILDGWDRYCRMLPIALATGVFVKAFTSMVSESPSAEPSCSETNARERSRGR
jgi:asparagine synthase (glutamine-hydrolysing)